MNRQYQYKLIMFCLLAASVVTGGAAWASASDQATLRLALRAIDHCVQWAGEGYQNEAAFKRDCAKARKPAAVAYKHRPIPRPLSTALLLLHDLNYFDLSDSEKSRLCHISEKSSDKDFDENEFPNLAFSSMSAYKAICLGQGGGEGQ